MPTKKKPSTALVDFDGTPEPADAPFVEWRAIDDVIPYARNPRKNSSAIGAVAASLQEFGWRQPIVVDPDGVVIVGHTRLEAARGLGYDRVPVHVAHGLTKSQVKAYRLADNRTAENAEWDRDLLALELNDLRLDDYDLTLTAFTEQEMEGVMGEALDRDPLADDGADAPDVKTGQFGVIVLCSGEEQQRAIYDRLVAEGLECKVVVT